MTMTSSRPYLVKALYEWIVENDCTPYVLVNAMADYVEVPQQFVKDGQIVLNVSPIAVIDLLITNEAIQFNGRFGGVAMDIYVPMTAVMGIYARENNQGMIFDLDGSNSEPPLPDDPEPTGTEPSGAKPSASKTSSSNGKKPGLRVVK